MKKLLSILALTFFSATVFTPCSAIAKAMQHEPEMAGTLRSNGMIYVLVGIMLIILAGLFLYLMSIERKVKKLEQKIEDNR